MTSSGATPVVIRFAADIGQATRTSLDHQLRDADASVTIGWDLGERGPTPGRADPVAVISLMADVAARGSDAVTRIGIAARDWLGLKFPQQAQDVHLEIVNHRTQVTVRIRASDSADALRLLPEVLSMQLADQPIGWNGREWGEEQAPGETEAYSAALPDDLTGPRAFICYAHESDDHKRTVRELVEFLMSQGIDAHMDSRYQDERRDWQLWATSQIKAADFVLVIASPRCRMVGDGEVSPDEHRGLQAEMNILRELYIGQPGVWPRRILPVVLPGYSVDDIPIFLQPWTADHYIIKDLTTVGAASLLAHLIPRPPLADPQ